jgi:F-type H+-transporting ATPase subunit a
MGEHTTWFDYLHKFDWWRDFAGKGGFLQQKLGREWQWAIFEDTYGTVTHVLVGLLVALFVLYGASRFYAGVRGGGTAALVPPRRFNLRAMFEMLCDAIYGTMVNVMGEKHAKKFFPLIGSLALFILFGNLCAVIPGLAPATDTLKTTLVLGALVFVITHIYGIKEHGVAYFKHFCGPIWWLAPLILPIELISHIVRPVSLALRLMGNMTGDHMVLFVFFTLVPLIVPVPFLILGILVSVVQALVFCLLSMVYISMAVSHDH